MDRYIVIIDKALKANSSIEQIIDKVRAIAGHEDKTKLESDTPEDKQATIFLTMEMKKVLALRVQLRKQVSGNQI